MLPDADPLRPELRSNICNVNSKHQLSHQEQNSKIILCLTKSEPKILSWSCQSPALLLLERDVLTVQIYVAYTFFTVP